MIGRQLNLNYHHENIKIELVIFLLESFRMIIIMDMKIMRPHYITFFDKTTNELLTLKN